MKVFLIGLGIGLLVAIIVYIAKQIKINRLNKLLNDRMELESSGLAGLKKEVEELKKQNENLRITNAALAQKPGRAEIQRLQVYQKAVDRLVLNAPGFGAAWQSALSESEEEFAKIYSGTKPFWKKVIPGNTDAKAIEESSES